MGEEIVGCLAGLAGLGGAVRPPRLCVRLSSLARRRSVGPGRVAGALLALLALRCCAAVARY